MAISSITVKPSGTFAVTGGTDVVYSSVGVGKLVNLAANLSSPEQLEIQSTMANDSGKESSYLVKLVDYTAPPVGAPYGSPDPKLQVHLVIKCDTSVWTDATIQDRCLRMAHMLITPGFITKILRGDK